MSLAAVRGTADCVATCVYAARLTSPPTLSKLLILVGDSNPC
jgi:hypothetical protein